MKGQMQKLGHCREMSPKGKRELKKRQKLIQVRRSEMTRLETESVKR